MKNKDKKILCSLIRDHEDSLGSSRLTMLALKAFIESIKDVRCNIERVRKLYVELAVAIKNTEPKVIPLIHLIEEFEKEMGDEMGDEIDKLKQKAISILESKHEKIKSKIGKVIEHGLNCINEGDVIVVHTASYDLTNMLVIAKEVFQKNFKAIVLKQDFSKTKRLINKLSEAGVEMQVIPEYSLGHYMDQVNKIFIGSLSVTDDMKVVTAVGTANVVSLCHLNQLPVYMLSNTLKFSHRPSSKQKIHIKIEKRNHDNCSYQLVTHSHDMLDLKHVDYLITEHGIQDKSSMKEYLKNPS